MNIYQKLIEVRKSVPYLKKEAEGYQFKYTSSSQVLGNLKAAMDELGLLLIPTVTDKKVTIDTYEKIDGKGNAKRTVDYFTEINVTFTWINAENPEEKIECPWYGQGVDTAGEKGVGKALTYAEKYFMLKFFNIPTDKDDPDSFQNKIDGNDKPKDNNKGTQKPPATPQKPSTPAPPSTPSGQLISEDQVKRLYAIAKGNVDIARSVLADFHYGSAKEIKKSDYEKVVKAIEEKI